ncbi:nuclear transport factor 2 family protein [Nocardia sp. NBC_00511]|uniref:nuclear transport factor 2 family protein n=1 Tax=Nocardia sp. NBC_00511 TaxID=2903591 RepID=UPI0030DEC18C
MNTESVIDVVQRVYAALAAGDVQALAELTDPDVEIFQSELLPYGGYHRGLSGLQTFLEGVRTALDSQIEVGQLFVAGDRVVQIGRSHGTARATGVAFDVPEVQVWKVYDGRILGLTVYLDDSALLAALTAEPAAAVVRAKPQS